LEISAQIEAAQKESGRPPRVSEVYDDGAVVLLDNDFQVIKPDFVGGVTVYQVRATVNPQFVQMTLQQFVRRRLTTSTILQDLMADVDQFNQNIPGQPPRTIGNLQRRVCWQNISKKRCADLGIYGNLANDWEALEAADMRTLIFREPPQYIHVTLDGRVLEPCLVEIHTFLPRTWEDPATGKRVVQQPKRGGAGGDILKYGDKAIFRNVAVSYKGMDDIRNRRRYNFDLFVGHTNKIEGSTAKAKKALGLGGRTIFGAETVDQINQREALLRQEWELNNPGVPYVKAEATLQPVNNP